MFRKLRKTAIPILLILTLLLISACEKNTSVTNKGISRIVPFLNKGAGVVTTRAHVQYIVTEYGVADLYGKTIDQRVTELIKISHPDFRESMAKEYFEATK